MPSVRFLCETQSFARGYSDASAPSRRDSCVSAERQGSPYVNLSQRGLTLIRARQSISYTPRGQPVNLFRHIRFIGMPGTLSIAPYTLPIAPCPSPPAHRPLHIAPSPLTHLPPPPDNSPPLPHPKATFIPKNLFRMIKSRNIAL